MLPVKGICEPFTNLPQKIDLGEIEKETHRTFLSDQQDEDEQDPKDFIHIVDAYNILPMFKRQLDHLKPFLSVHKNRYMALKWKKFLDNVPAHFVTIQMHKDIPPPPQKIRRMTLNGQFYGVDYKLAPLPVAPDPRNYSKDKKKGQDKQQKIEKKQSQNSNNK